ncbi:MAG: hypothetical protein KDC44_10030 [Phaeodactylibacter sp.]|nr:hypothetical protein [Phaeodactylibacter sp.]
MKFSNILGQASNTALLRQLVQQGRTPHALLLLGPEGSGKLTAALALAQYMLCTNRGEDACGECSHCKKAAKWIHPDIHYTFPTVGTNITSERFLPEWRTALSENPYMDVNQWLQRIGAENKQGNINKEECVRIVRKLSLKAFEGQVKVLILWLPEYLGREGNRLLKLIEEPPAQTHFILVAENQELILNTILSRCQLVKFNALEDAAVVRGLQEQHGLSEDRALEIAHLADGNFNEALELMAKAENDLANLFLDWLRKCYLGNGLELLEWSDRLADLGREQQKHLLRYALHFLEEFLLLKATGRTALRLRASELETARRMQQVIELDQLEQLVERLTDAIYHIERNANPKVLFLHLGIQIHKILRRKSLVPA